MSTILQAMNANIAGIVHVHGKCKPQYNKVRSVSCKAHINEEVSMRGKMTNYYEVLRLGSSEKVSIGEIRKAYRRMALRYHPDVCAEQNSTRRFVELQKAYETLSDPVSRKLHDYELGLINSVGSLSQEVSSEFPKHVWEAQLCRLKERCRVRMETKNTKRSQRSQ